MQRFNHAAARPLRPPVVSNRRNTGHFFIPPGIWTKAGCRVDTAGRILPRRVEMGNGSAALDFVNLGLVVPIEIFADTRNVEEAGLAVSRYALSGIQGFPRNSIGLGKDPGLDAFVNSLNDKHPLFTSTEVTVVLSERLAGPFVVRPLGDRKFLLEVRQNDAYAEKVASICRGLSLVAIRNRAIERFVVGQARHDLRNGASVLVSVEGLLKIRAAIPVLEGVHDLVASIDSFVAPLRPEESGFLLLDRIIGDRLSGAFDFWADLCELEFRFRSTRPAFKRNPKAKKLADMVPHGLVRIKEVIFSTCDQLLDLASADIVAPMSLSEVLDEKSGGEVIARWKSQIRPGLSETTVMGNPQLIRSVLNELFSNAERAAQTQMGQNGAEDKMGFSWSVAGNKLIIEISNAVDKPEAVEALATNDGLLSETIDSNDGWTKQRLFLPGVTTRAKHDIGHGVGGFGLAFTWEHVKAMGGNIRADYDKDARRFTMTVELPLAEPVGV